MSYWLDVFTVETWNEAAAHGYSVSGFNQNRRGFAKGIHVGDILICYLGSRVGRITGALEVTSELFESETPRIWKSDVYPVRFETKPLITLPAEHGIPLLELAPKLEMFRALSDPKKWGILVQGSPSRIARDSDGVVLMSELSTAAENPVQRPMEKRARRTQRTDPPQPVRASEGDVPPAEERAHTEMQYLLLKLGSDMGLDVWAAQNDGSRSWHGHRLADVPKFRTKLPEQFDPYTQRIVELIDVLWIEHEGIRFAFEVENSTNVYGGLLRMSDLITRRPGLSIPLYIVAPEERFEKVRRELNRPTFTAMKTPLVEVCKFISYRALRDAVQTWGPIATDVRPEAIDRIAVSCRFD